jgi:hypothetical protein
LVNGGSGPVNYTVNQQPFSMAPTFEQNLPVGQSWTVEFDRGGGAGTTRYQLADGVYKFTPTPQGWELYRQDFMAMLDNSHNKFEFHYVHNNAQQSLPAGQTKDLSGPRPAVIRFDNGSQQVKQKKLESGTYKVAVAPDNTIDLFPAEAVTVPPPVPPQASSQVAGAGAPAKRLPPGFKLFDPLASVLARAGKSPASAPVPRSTARPIQ